MNQKSKQLRAEENKTIRITELIGLRFKAMKPENGIIEIANRADQGRVCTLKVSDFKSMEDAKVYAQLLVLAPQLLGEYLSDVDRLEQSVRRFEKRFNAFVEKHEKKKRSVKKSSTQSRRTNKKRTK